MNFYEIEDRLNTLMLVYSYTRDHAGLTIGQRICLTMERVACMRALDKIREQGYTEVTLTYQIPEALNEKVKFLRPKAIEYERHQARSVASSY